MALKDIFCSLILSAMHLNPVKCSFFYLNSNELVHASLNVIWVQQIKSLATLRGKKLNLSLGWFTYEIENNIAKFKLRNAFV